MKTNTTQSFLALCTLFLTLCTSVKSQSVAINTDGSAPDPKAILDVKSTTQGFLMPRMTRAERLAIASPTTGLIIFQNNNFTGEPLGFYYYNGSAWKPLFDATKGWSLTGNSGTNPNNGASSNFIGTTDAQDFAIWTNNAEKMRVTSAGNVGIGIVSPTYKLHVNGRIKSTGITESSDQRYKENIVAIENALEKVLALKGVMYKWKQKEFPGMFNDSTLQMGLIAQEVEKIIPEVVETDKEGYKSVEYSHLVALLIEAIKMQEQEISKLKAELASQEDLEKLKAEVKAIQSYLSKEASK